jgi:hypothetical protein
MRILTLLFFISLTANIFGQNKKAAYQFSIQFASCFDNDMVGLKINGTKIFDSLQMTTYDKVIDITDIGVYQDDKGLWFVNSKQKENQRKISVKDSLILDVTLNGQLNTFHLPLNKGKIVFINYCFVKSNNTTKKKLTIAQYTKPVQLD